MFSAHDADDARWTENAGWMLALLVLERLMRHGRRQRWAAACVLAACCLGSATAWGQQGHGHWGSHAGGTYSYVPEATGQPPPSSYVTTQGSVHLHLPRHRKPPCQRPASICIKPKIWTFSQAFYQLHHEVWHGVTDPCWLMDPDCCGTSCNHQKSFGLLCLFPWIKSQDNPRAGVSPCRQCSGAEPDQAAPARCDRCQDEVGPDAIELDQQETTPTPAEPPVEHPQAARRGPLRSVLLRRE
jgi:hypothetical protein